MLLLVLSFQRKCHVVGLNRSLSPPRGHITTTVVVGETLEKQNSTLDYIFLKNEECDLGYPFPFQLLLAIDASLGVRTGQKETRARGFSQEEIKLGPTRPNCGLGKRTLAVL